MSDTPDDEERSRPGLAGRLVNRVVNPIVGAVDVGGVVEQIDIDALLEQIDLDELIARVDLDAVISRVDIQAVIDKVDINAVMAKVDIDALMSRVDIDGLMGRVDVNALMEQVDVQGVIDRVDINAILRETELGAIIARSTTGVFGQVLDLARALVLTLDEAVQTTIGRIVRPRGERRTGRPDAPDDVVDTITMTPADRAVALQGHHAGSISRFLTFLLDQFLLGALFVFGMRLVTLASSVVIGRTFDPGDHRGLTGIGYLVWAFLYLVVPLALLGRTPGMAVGGLLMVDADGAPLGGWRAAVRTAVMPLSFALLGIGLLVGLVRRDRRQLHDLLAGTAIVYGWDARLARLRADEPDVEVADG